MLHKVARGMHFVSNYFLEDRVNSFGKNLRIKRDRWQTVVNIFEVKVRIKYCDIKDSENKPRAQ